MVFLILVFGVIILSYNTNSEIDKEINQELKIIK